MSTEKPTSLAKFFLLLREPCEALTMYCYQQAASAALKPEQLRSFKFGNTFMKTHKSEASSERTIREKMSTEKPTSLAKFFFLLREPCEALTMYCYQQAPSAALKPEQLWSFQFGNTLWKLVNQQLPVRKLCEALTMYYQNRHWKLGQQSAICWIYLGLFRDYGLDHIFF